MRKKIVFQIFFIYSNLPHRRIIFSIKNKIFAKIFAKILLCRQYFSLLNTFIKKGKDPEPDPDPYLWQMDPDPGGPKHADPDPQHCFHEYSQSDLCPEHRNKENIIFCRRSLDNSLQYGGWQRLVDGMWLKSCWLMSGDWTAVCHVSSFFRTYLRLLLYLNLRTTARHPSKYLLHLFFGSVGTM